MKPRHLILVLSLLTAWPTRSDAQIGLPFLKIGTGARQAGLGGVFTGIADDAYAVYWNPGGLGHIREWQWSASYTKWFTDLYQASFYGARQMRVLGSRKTAIGLGVSYVGMPEWDATGGKEAPVSAGHFVGSLALSQRLDWLSRCISIGASIKGISSRLANYNATSWAADFGLLFKSSRFGIGPLGFGIFDYGVLSAGASLLHTGGAMTFDAVETELPQTARAGLSFRMGRHHGFSLLLGGDHERVKGRDGVTAVAGELWWRELLGVRAGWRINQEDLGDFSVGFGLRWNDVMSAMLNLPTRFGDAFQFDISEAGYGEVLKSTYRGSLSHYTVAPEPFRLGETKISVSQVLCGASQIRLDWEEAFDPDPFDKVAYWVLVNKDSAVIDRAVRKAERDLPGFLNSGLPDSLQVCESSTDTSQAVSVNEGGLYYWAVVAYDLDDHARLASKGDKKIGEFVVPTADLLVRTFNFKPSEWITRTPEQGEITIAVTNMGLSPADSFAVKVIDHVVTDRGDTVFQTRRFNIGGLICADHVTVRFAWESVHPGIHWFETVLDPDTSVLEMDRTNNVRIDTLYSIPKGGLTVPDTVEVMATGFDSTQVPIVPEIYFAPFSDTVAAEYVDSNEPLPSIFSTLAERLLLNSDVTLSIRGYADPMSGERDAALAESRARRVAAELEALGVPSGSLQIEPSKVRPDPTRIPPDSMDAKWIQEQNRSVVFSVPQRGQEERIFGPINVAVDTTLRDSVAFDLNVFSPAGSESWIIKAEPRAVEINQSRPKGKDLRGTITWNGTDKDGMLVSRNRWHRYQFLLMDSLGRSFRTRMDSVYLAEKRTIRRREIFGAAQFGKVEPVYAFYWEHLMDIAREMTDNPSMRLRFEGHACAIGSFSINERLSQARAQRITEAFLERVKQYYPAQYTDIRNRIDSSIGYGERDPLRIKLRGQGETLLGDNDHPVGRYYNRRIMVLLYREN